MRIRIWRVAAVLFLAVNVSVRPEDSWTNEASLAKVESTLPRIHPIVADDHGYKQLIDISDTISKQAGSCWGWDYAGSTREIEKIKDLTRGMAVVPHRLCLSTNEFGNTLGYFLNDLACSDLVGAHFLTTYHRLFIIGQDGPVTENDLITKKDALDFYTFVKALPNIVIHHRPNSITTAQSLVSTHCACTKYCWEDPQAPWLKRIDAIGDYMRAAILQYMNETHAEELGTVLNANDLISGHKSPRHSYRTRRRDVARILPQTSTRSAPVYSSFNFTVQNTHSDVHPDDWLPLVPDVTIQYRCGDNLNFDEAKYGLIPFRVFSKRRILVEAALKEPDINYIYVITEGLARARQGGCRSCCNRILPRLHAYLSYLFPNAVVVIKRGDSVLADYARIAFSKVVFCSASTFCLWPALANKEGTVFLPYTSLFGGAANTSVAPNLGSNRKFYNAEMVSTFNGLVTGLLAHLE